MNSDEIGDSGVEDHVTLNETNKEVEGHDKPNSNSENRGKLTRQKHIHIVKEIGNWLSSSIDIDEHTKNC